MKIKKIEVVDLFNIYSYSIEFINHDSISIVHAPNGYGKTTVFQLIRDTFNMYLLGILEVPFSRFSIELSDDSIITIIKKKLIQKSSNAFLINKMPFSCSIHFSIVEHGQQTAYLTISDCDRFVAILRRIGDINELMHRFDLFANDASNHNIDNSLICGYEEYMKKIDDLNKKIRITFVESNRLYEQRRQGNFENLFLLLDYYRGKRVVSRRDPRNSVQEISEEKIAICANQIKETIKDIREEYGLQAETIDRSFLNRLISITDDDELLSDKEIEDKLRELEDKRKELESIGLVLGGGNQLPFSGQIDNTMRKIYTLYIKDSFDKLKLYDKIKSKLQFFINVINEKTTFSNKKMAINQESGIVFYSQSNSGKPDNIKYEIPLNKLSSGEKHNFILFYELIFNSNAQSVFLIDEPEISLHVAWQMQFIDILKEICKSNGIQAIIATHSPDIVNGHNDLLISIGLEENYNE